MRLMRVAAGMAIAAVLAVGFAEPSGAGWLSRLTRGAAEAGGGAAVKSGKLGLGALDNAAAHVATLPKMSTGAALAAHVTP
jgi:hypothetical protein